MSLHCLHDFPEEFRWVPDRLDSTEHFCCAAWSTEELCAPASISSTCPEQSYICLAGANAIWLPHLWLLDWKFISNRQFSRWNREPKGAEFRRSTSIHLNLGHRSGSKNGEAKKSQHGHSGRLLPTWSQEINGWVNARSKGSHLAGWGLFCPNSYT